MSLPSTRYYGSKRRLISWIWKCIEESDASFCSVLDLFGGSGVFSYYAKRQMKNVHYNDLFKFNYHIGKAIIENNSTELSNEDIEFLLTKHSTIDYQYKISDYFDGIYYPNEENIIIDIALNNINNLDDGMKISMLYYILIQNCLIKRPFNLFHRSNLNLRTNDVQRSFGNKKTWERTFQELFYRFSRELNDSVFDNGFINTSNNYSALECNLTADLVYLDPPYIDVSSHTTYQSKYHFLEAMVNYVSFEQCINYTKKNKEVIINGNYDFESKLHITKNLEYLIGKYGTSYVVLSYRTGGIPSIENIERIINSFERKYEVYKSKHSYALHKNNGKQEEVLFIIHPRYS